MPIIPKGFILLFGDITPNNRRYGWYHPIRYDTMVEFNVDSKAEYSALSSTRSQKKRN